MAPPDSTAAPDQDEVLRRFLRGESGACREVERWAWDIVRFKRYHIPGDTRGDVVQQTLAEVWRLAAEPGFRLKKGFRPLVRTIAARRCLDYLRRPRPWVELTREPMAQAESQDRPLIREQARVRVREALQSLGPTCKEIMILLWWEERTISEIAERRGVKPVTVRVQKRDCMEQLAKKLRKSQEFAPE